MILMMRTYMRYSLVVAGAVSVFLAGRPVTADVWLAEGLEVEFYGHASVIPGAIDFDNAGALFIGNEEGDDSFDVPIFKIEPGGGEGAPFGDPLPDPDTVVVDKDGAFHGTPGAVLVGGKNFHIGKGYVAYILPDGTNTFVWEFLVAPDNMGRMTFDTHDRLLLSAGPAFGTYRSPDSDELPSLLVGPYEDGPQTVATDADDRFYTSSSQGTVSFYSSAGEVIDLDFSTNLGFITELVIGPGADWGSDLYASNTVGELYRIDASGNPTLIGSGFNRIASITFGPDDALYLADFVNGDILKITNASEPIDSDNDGLLDDTEIEMAMGTGCPDPLDADSDDDGLLDGEEVDLGTDPCNADTDGDGVGDTIDPTPTDPGVPPDFLDGLAHDLCVSIKSLDLSLFNGPNNNANKGRRNALANRACNAAKSIVAGDFLDAIDKLQSLLDKIDGLNLPPDWMVDSPERTGLATQTQLLIYLLLLL